MAVVQVLVGSVYGGALLTARAIRDQSGSDEHQFVVHETPDLSALTTTDGPVLVCTSTTGQGEVPPSLLTFYVQLRDQLPMQQGRPFGIIVLGDSSYGDTFCGAGTLMEEAFHEVAAHKVGDTLCIDAMETTDPESLALPWVQAWLDLVSGNTQQA